MVGGALITLLNNADRVKVACQAQVGQRHWIYFCGARWSGLAPDDLSSLQARHPACSWQRPPITNSVDAMRNKNCWESLITSLRQQFTDAGQRKIVFFVLNRELLGEEEVIDPCEVFRQ